MALAHPKSRLPLIIGHRGSSAVAPENTLAAFKQSILDGANGIEFDVRLAGDGVPVVIHDATVNRTATKEALHYLTGTHVSELSSTELSQVDVVGRFLNTPFEYSTKIPTLRALFELYVDAPGVLYLEMKGEPVEERLIREVVGLIHAHSFQQRVLVESFDHPALLLLKQFAPEVRTAPLFESGLRTALRFRSPEQILRRAERMRANEVALHYKLANDRRTRFLKDKGFEIVIWTVDDPEWIPTARRLGIKGVITNNPAAMLRYRDSLGV